MHQAGLAIVWRQWTLTNQHSYSYRFKASLLCTHVTRKRLYTRSHLHLHALAPMPLNACKYLTGNMCVGLNLYTSGTVIINSLLRVYLQLQWKQQHYDYQLTRPAVSSVHHEQLHNAPFPQYLDPWYEKWSRGDPQQGRYPAQRWLVRAQWWHPSEQRWWQEPGQWGHQQVQRWPGEGGRERGMAVYQHKVQAIQMQPIQLYSSIWMLLSLMHTDSAHLQ